MAIMIAHLSGTVIKKDAEGVVIDVSGIGYRVRALESTLEGISVGEKISLHTHLAVREDSMNLYGFAVEEELNFFELLLAVPGIGPKSALGVLSTAKPDVLVRAITSRDTSYLTKVSGIGKKTAEKIILELKDKVDAVRIGESGPLHQDSDVVEALKSLGYTRAEARESLKKVSEEISGTSARIKEALKYLGR